MNHSGQIDFIKHYLNIGEEIEEELRLIYNAIQAKFIPKFIRLDDFILLFIFVISSLQYTVLLSKLF